MVVTSDLGLRKVIGSHNFHKTKNWNDFLRRWGKKAHILCTQIGAAFHHNEHLRSPEFIALPAGQLKWSANWGKLLRTTFTLWRENEWKHWNGPPFIPRLGRRMRVEYGCEYCSLNDGRENGIQNWGERGYCLEQNEWEGGDVLYCLRQPITNLLPLIGTPTLKCEVISDQLALITYSSHVQFQLTNA